MRAFEDKENILQDEKEIAEYCDVLRVEEVSLYLEIGSKFGGSLWRAAQAMPKGSRVVAIDLPNGTKAWEKSRASLEECVAELKKQGYDARIIWGNSQSPEVIRKAALYGPYHAIMIDADHRLPGVNADWENYSGMARSMVAFHDIAWKRAPEWVGTRIDVPEFWNSIKNDYRHKEIIHCPTGKNNGIGVLWKD
jgi:cephalosporin hydroxylase